MIIQLPPTFLLNVPLDNPFIDDEISSSSSESNWINFLFSQIFEKDNNIIGSFNENIEMKHEIENKVKSDKPVFKTKLGKNKRGKKSEKINKKVHGACDRDNILSKIQIHFLNFVIYFLNDCIHKFFKNKRINLKKFNHADKSNSTNEHINTLKNYTINNLLEEMKISEKYTRFDKDFNKKIKDKLIQNPWFKKLLDMKYTTLFSYYCNNNQPLNEIFLFDEKIIFSPKTKSFYALLEKNNEYKEEFIELAKRFSNSNDEETRED